MATILSEATGAQGKARAFEVIHPLDDVAEEKCSPEGLGRMHMSRSVRWSLYALRGYLLTMGLLVAYRLLTLAGVLGHHAP
ncbi:MAG: hypothetical protein JO250_05120 [Armatimonadetes bacterium]|nr:hypothetical protein [Armatimonadota bacterium]